MKFPKQELDIDAYFEKIKQLLVDPHCHIFIDTNIISQLYRLNEDARIDFYNWVDTCSSRFHIPNWSVHEYSKRVTTQNTKDYLSELTKAKTFSKELKNIGKFLKAYVGDSLLTGSIYAGKMQELFDDMDNVSSKFEKIATVINFGLNQHQLNVHKEVLDKLETHILDSNMYSTLENLAFEADLRFDGKVPPGFKDSDKETNRIGDLVIWKEILEFCKEHKPESEKIKAVFISRDIKPDMVYRPIKQIKNGHPVNKEEDKVEIAHESLVGEFKLTTESDEYYLISFYTLVQILAPQYRNLAVSFQIATEPENLSAETQVTEIIVQEIESSESTNVEIAEAISGTPKETIPEVAVPAEAYSAYALEDEKYDTSRSNYVQSINQIIDELRSYNWYRQNPAIERLSTFGIENNEGSSQQFKDVFFVLGRNILQSAIGSSGSAIHFVETLHFQINHWKASIKRALIDGLLFEIFFDSKGKIRKKGFKADYINEIVISIKHIGLDVPYGFINNQLSHKNEGRFVPEVGSDKKYKFAFGFNITEPTESYPGDVETISLEIDGVDVSDTFKVGYGQLFSSCEKLNYFLSIHYGIPTENIELELIDEKIMAVCFIKEYDF
jgi:hypothetical protein